MLEKMLSRVVSDGDGGAVCALFNYIDGQIVDLRFFPVTKRLPVNPPENITVYKTRVRPSVIAALLAAAKQNFPNIPLELPLDPF